MVINQRLEQLLSTNGDGTGTVEMAGAAAVYKITPPAGWTYELHRLNVYIEDDGKFRGDRYGATEALTNGIVITLENAGGVLATLTPQVIKQIGHWHLLAGVDVFITDYTAGNDHMSIRWTFTKGGGAIKLVGDNGEFFKLNVQDDLGAGGAALVSHLVQIQGGKYWTG